MASLRTDFHLLFLSINSAVIASTHKRASAPHCHESINWKLLISHQTMRSVFLFFWRRTAASELPLASFAVEQPFLLDQFQLSEGNRWLLTFRWRQSSLCSHIAPGTLCRGCRSSKRSYWKSFQARIAAAVYWEPRLALMHNVCNLILRFSSFSTTTSGVGGARAPTRKAFSVIKCLILHTSPWKPHYVVHSDVRTGNVRSPSDKEFNCLITFSPFFVKGRLSS